MKQVCKTSKNTKNVCIFVEFLHGTMRDTLLPLLTTFQTDFKIRICNLIGCQETVKLVDRGGERDSSAQALQEIASARKIIYFKSPFTRKLVLNSIIFTSHTQLGVNVIKQIDICT